METWIDFGRGPLFRLAFAIMLLGLLRALALSVAGLADAYRRNADRIVPWRAIAAQTGAWLFPVGRFWRMRPYYGTASVLFHVGLLLVPLFFVEHVLLWKRAVGFAWPAVFPGRGQLAHPAGHRGRYRPAGGARVSTAGPGARAAFRIMPGPLAAGSVCDRLSGGECAPGSRRLPGGMFLHVYSADLILLLIPFTKLAHCVLAPLSQAVSAVGWKFPAGAGDRVAATLGYANRPCWVEKARLLPATAAGANQEVSVK